MARLWDCWLRAWAGQPAARVRNLVLPLATCIILGKLFHLQPSVSPPTKLGLYLPSLKRLEWGVKDLVFEDCFNNTVLLKNVLKTLEVCHSECIPQRGNCLLGGGLGFQFPVKDGMSHIVTKTISNLRLAQRSFAWNPITSPPSSCQGHISPGSGHWEISSSCGEDSGMGRL